MQNKVVKVVDATFMNIIQE